MEYGTVIIGINYCSGDETLKWIRSIPEDKRILTVVVDTSAEKTDPELEKALKDLREDVMYLNPGENLGYFGGARYGLSRVREKGIAFDALIVSNVDLRFETEDLVGVIQSYDAENAGVLAPSILSDGKDMNPYKLERMTRAQQERRILYLKHPAFQKGVDLIRGIRKQRQQTAEYPDGMKIYMGYGACFVFLRRYFDRGGNLDLPLFLYGEEPYVAEMCRDLKLDILYAPRIRIRNVGHVSVSTMPSKRQREYMIRSAEYCIEHYYRS